MKDRMGKEMGITLIELLAAISILLIISSTIYGVFIGVNKNSDKISSKNKLEQQANIIFSVVKSFHFEDDPYTIKFNKNSNLFTIESASMTNQLGDKTTIYSLEVRTKTSNATLSNNTDSIVITPNSSKSIHLILHLGTNGEYIYQTSIKRY